jgi:hypothetical protein
MMGWRKDEEEEEIEKVAGSEKLRSNKMRSKEGQDLFWWGDRNAQGRGDFASANNC